MIRLLAAVLLITPGEHGAEDARAAGTVESCRFSTQCLPPAFRVPRRFAEGYRLFQAGAAYLPESVTVKSVVLLGNSQIGLTARETQELYTNLDRVYGSISNDAMLKGIRSVLPCCLGEERPTEGHYFAYYPDQVVDDTPVIVFLHGFGGNFLFYTYLLKEEFPRAVVLLPSWDGGWYDGKRQYLDDMYNDVKRKKGLTIRKPLLMAISAGGPAGFRFYQDAPDRFAGLVSIASAPPLAMVPALKEDLKILMLNGRLDSGFRIGHVERIAARLAERLPAFKLHVVEGDHFFLLSKRDETFRAIKVFQEVLGGKGPPQR